MVRLTYLTHTLALLAAAGVTARPLTPPLHDDAFIARAAVGATDGTNADAAAPFDLNHARIGTIVKAPQNNAATDDFAAPKQKQPKKDDTNSDTDADTDTDSQAQQRKGNHPKTTAKPTATATKKAPAAKQSDPRTWCHGRVSPQGPSAVECNKSLDQYLEDQAKLAASRKKQDEEEAKAKAEEDAKKYEHQTQLVKEGAINCTAAITPDRKTTLNTSMALGNGTWLNKNKEVCNPDLDFRLETTNFNRPVVRMCVEGNARVLGNKSAVDMVTEWLDSGVCVHGNCPGGVQNGSVFTWGKGGIGRVVRQGASTFWYDSTEWWTSLKVNFASTDGGYQLEDDMPEVKDEMWDAARTGILEAVKRMTTKETIKTQNWNEAGTEMISDGGLIDQYKVPQQLVYVSKTLMGGTVQVSLEFDSGSADSACDMGPPLQQWLGTPVGQLTTSVIPGFKEFGMFADAVFTFDSFFDKCPSNEKFGDIGDAPLPKDLTSCHDLYGNEAQV